MATITIESNKKEDLYFINELAKRLGLATRIEPNNPLNNDKHLTQMGTTSSNTALKDFLLNETEKMF